MDELMKSLLSAKMRAFEDSMSDDGRIYKQSLAKYQEMLACQNRYNDSDVFIAYREMIGDFA